MHTITRQLRARAHDKISLKTARKLSTKDIQQANAEHLSMYLIDTDDSLRQPLIHAQRRFLRDTFSARLHVSSSLIHQGAHRARAT